MRNYRAEVGTVHGLRAGNLMGAIANEAGLSARQIGRIDILDTFSLVELPADLPSAVLTKLKGVQVFGQRLRLRPFPPGEGTDAPAPARPSRPAATNPYEAHYARAPRGDGEAPAPRTIRRTGAAPAPRPYPRAEGAPPARAVRRPAGETGSAARPAARPAKPGFKAGAKPGAKPAPGKLKRSPRQ
jgi:hypothetical protein